MCAPQGELAQSEWEADRHPCFSSVLLLSLSLFHQPLSPPTFISVIFYSSFASFLTHFLHQQNTGKLNFRNLPQQTFGICVLYCVYIKYTMYTCNVLLFVLCLRFPVELCSKQAEQNRIVKLHMAALRLEYCKELNVLFLLLKSMRVVFVRKSKNILDQSSV